MRKLPLLLLAVILSACLPATRPLTLYNWSYPDLVALDPMDSTRPDLDLIAFYQRADQSELQIRLDFLDLNLTPAYDLYLALDLAPGGTRTLPIETSTALEWDDLVVIPAQGQPAVLDSDLRPRADLIPRVIRDPDLDMVVISLVQPVLGADLRILQAEIFLTPAGEQVPADQITLSGTSGPRLARAPALLAFWNTFPAYSPAQALRRWDGAHTGPFGERHGLSHLIRGAAAYKVPITLLDIKTPLALSALDYMGQLSTVRTLAEDGLLTLPDVLPLPHEAVSGGLPFVPPESALIQGTAMSRDAAGSFDLPSSRLLYAPLTPANLPATYLAVFLSTTGDSHPAGAPTISLARWEGRALIPLPGAVHPLQATAEGLALPLREQLLELALAGSALSSPGAQAIILLGGDLPASAWGDPQASRAALRYIAEHPWIRAVSPEDLLTTRPSLTATPPPPPLLPEAIPNNLDGLLIPTGQTVDQIQMEILTALERLPSGSTRDLAWAAYFALLAPNPPLGEELAALRRGYLGQVGGILAAADWAADPFPIVDCAADPDFDGQPECILANERLFSIFEPAGARMTFGFILTPAGLSQWIGPLSQFQVGLSDPADWEPGRGPAGDPADVPGAFSDTRARWDFYEVAELPGGLRFSTPAGEMIKTFTLTPTGLNATIQSQGSDPYTVQVPLALRPEVRFSEGWGSNYQATFFPDGLVWQLGPDFRVRLTTAGSHSLRTFGDSVSSLGVPEDPNLDYPPGHFVPFPLAIAEITTAGDLEIQIQVME